MKMAYQYFLRLVLLSISILLIECVGVVGANSNQVVRGWRVDEFPSPMSSSSAAASNNNGEAEAKTDEDNSDDSSKRNLKTMTTMVVDPDGILSGASRDELNSKIYNFIDDVTVSIPNEEQSFAVQLAIAIVERMDLSSYQQEEEQDEEIAAEEFCRKLHDKWGVGHETGQGGTGIVIFLSVYDRVIFISKGGALDKLLSDSRIESIIRNVRPALKQANYLKGLMQAVDGIKQYCTQGEPDWTERILNFLEGPYLFIVIWFAILANGLFGAYRQREEARAYAQAQSQLSEIDRARAQALQGQYEVKSCPICLENFVSSEIGSDNRPIKLLRCGHCFDDTCWSEWINSGQGTITKCPICKKDIGDASASEAAPTPTETPQHQTNRDNNNNDNSLVESVHSHDVPRQQRQQHPEAERAVQRFQQERNFRLMRLATRYPRYISNNQLARWTSSTYRGELAQDPTFVNNNPRVAANRGNGGFGSNGGGPRPTFSFGGGRSSGGRGGRF